MLSNHSPCPLRKPKEGIDLEVDSPFFSAIVLFKHQPFPLGFWLFSGKKDPWNDWESYS